jgi:uncharacterized protein YjbJ (UPF0337 family)
LNLAAIRHSHLPDETIACRDYLSEDKTMKGSSSMDREHIKGTAEKAKGAIKETAGKVTGDKKLQTEGKLDKAKGAAHNVAGDVKDTVKHSND